MAWVSLGNALEARREPEPVVQTYRKAVESEPVYPQAWYDLGVALCGTGRIDQAVQPYGKVLEQDPGYAEAWCNLGDVLQRLGLLREALAARRRVDELGRARPGWHYPSGAWVREIEDLLANLAEPISRVEAHLEAGDAPAPDDLPRLAAAARAIGLVRTAASWYRDALVEDSGLILEVRRGHLPEAARAAVAAASGYGDAAALRDQERAEWRDLARGWIAAALERFELSKEDDEARGRIARLVNGLLRDPAISAIRADSLDRLPESERPAWRKLWDDAARISEKSR